MDYKSSLRTDIIFENKKIKKKKKILNDIDIYTTKNKSFLYKTIQFKSIDNIKIKEVFKEELKELINQTKSDRLTNILVIGLGNDSHTADSIGVKCLKYINATNFYELLGIPTRMKVSILKSGTLVQTGIDPLSHIIGIKDLIKPDLIIVIDAFIINDIENLNKTIELNNEGITPGSGILGINKEISYDTLNVPTIIVGIPTSIEIKDFKEDSSLLPYLLCTKDIDSFIFKSAKIIGEGINEVLLSFN